MKELFLLRGVPGAGKSTLAKSLGGMHIESDKYFMDGDEYKFDPSKLKDAHAWCQNAVKVWTKNGVEKIVISNTFTQEWEMDYYFDLAKEHGYRVYSLIVENRHGNKDVHNVPEEKLVQMKQRFEIKL
jgi:predicted kinase